MSTRVTVSKTIRLDVEFYREIEKVVASRDTTFTALTTEALEIYLHRDPRAVSEPAAPYGLPSSQIDALKQEIKDELIRSLTENMPPWNSSTPKTPTT